MQPVMKANPRDTTAGRPSRGASSLGASLRAGDGPNFVRVGDGRPPVSDLYHALIRMSWPGFISLFLTAFFTFNLVFAAAYAFDIGGLNVAPAEHLPSFAIAFFFSVHTLATVGYGNIYPADLFTNIVVVVEITLGLLFFALTTGLVFARFSRPTARVLFSDVAVVRPMEGAQMLLLRAANQRRNFIFEATVRCSILRLETFGGHAMRRFYDLKLERSLTPVFSLSWTIMHRIDEDSPLYGITQEMFEERGYEIIFSLTGIDSSVSQPIHARAAYGAGQVLWNREFVDVLSTDESGRLVIDYRRFHDTVISSE
ncbi:MAG TPA: ion channel [Methylocystis sp.]|nr:ion channel [Methylocystis sp.]